MSLNTDSLRAAFETGLASMGVALEPPQVAAALQYLSLLDKWNRVYSLSAIREPERMLTHHLLDSYSVLPAFEAFAPQRILDVGSGGGMPGMLLAIARPQWHITLIDSNSKKTAFLQQTAIQLGLANVSVATARVEQFVPTEAYDVITSRAFAELVDFVTLAGCHLKSSGRMLALKGVYPHEEIRRLPADWQVESVLPLHVPGLDAERHLVNLVRKPS